MLTEFKDKIAQLEKRFTTQNPKKSHAQNRVPCEELKNIILDTFPQYPEEILDLVL